MGGNPLLGSGATGPRILPVDRPLPERLAAHLAASSLLAGAPGLLVAYSGGGDSTALLLLLEEHARRAGVPLAASHVAHGLRGGAGEADAAFCERLCRERGIDFALLRVDVPAFRALGESPEAAARRLRYAALIAEAARRGGGGDAWLVATGHTCDDQAETVLLNLERHAGRTRGGIRARRADGVVRPLLPFRRAELRAWLAGRGVPFREDETNADPRFARNRIRGSVLPVLEARMPGSVERLARAGNALAERLARVDRLLDGRLAAGGLPVEGPWPRALLREVGPEAAARLLVRAAARGGRVPGRAQLTEALARVSGTEPEVRTRLAGQVLLADRRAVRLLPAGP